MPTLDRTTHGSIQWVKFLPDIIRIEIQPSTPKRVPPEYVDMQYVGDPLSRRHLLSLGGYREPDPIYIEFTGTARRFLIHRTKELALPFHEWPGKLATVENDDGFPNIARALRVTGLVVGGERLI